MLGLFHGHRHYYSRQGVTGSDSPTRRIPKDRVSICLTALPLPWAHLPSMFEAGMAAEFRSGSWLGRWPQYNGYYYVPESRPPDPSPWRTQRSPIAQRVLKSIKLRICSSSVEYSTYPTEENVIFVDLTYSMVDLALHQIPNSLDTRT